MEILASLSPLSLRNLLIQALGLVIEEEARKNRRKYLAEVLVPDLITKLRITLAFASEFRISLGMDGQMSEQLANNLLAI
jgi:hypothetical protein